MKQSRNRAKSNAVSLSPLNSTAYPSHRWVVTYPSPDGGPRKKKRFQAKKEAEAFAKEKETKIASMGKEIATLPDNTLQELVWCQNQLKPYDKSLTDVVKEWLEHQKQLKTSISVSEAIEELISAKEAVGKKERTLGFYRSKLNPFGEAFKDQPMCFITSAQVEAWLSKLEVTANTRNGYYRSLKLLFNFGKKRNYNKTNPMHGIDLSHEEESNPNVITVEQLKMILLACGRDLMPSMVIAAFCGVRTAELERLTWDNVDLSKKRLTIPSTVAKNRTTRHIPIPDCAIQWLKGYEEEEGKILKQPRSVSTFRKQLKIAHGFDWPKNCLRASFVSYAVAKTQNHPQVAIWAGHGLLVSGKHYLEGLPQEQGEEYFNLCPKG